MDPTYHTICGCNTRRPVSSGSHFRKCGLLCFGGNEPYERSQCCTVSLTVDSSHSSSSDPVVASLLAPVGASGSGVDSSACRVSACVRSGVAAGTGVCVGSAIGSGVVVSVGVDDGSGVCPAVFGVSAGFDRGSGAAVAVGSVAEGSAVAVAGMAGVPVAVGNSGPLHAISVPAARQARRNACIGSIFMATAPLAYLA